MEPGVDARGRDAGGCCLQRGIFFGCIQPHGGADSVTRIVKMPTPDAYCDLCASSRCSARMARPELSWHAARAAP